MMVQVLGWREWGSQQAEDGGEEHENALVEYLVQHPEHICSGFEHQSPCYPGVPMFSDGKALECSFRHWGHLMAQAEGLNDKHPYAYVRWAWERPCSSPKEWLQVRQEAEAHLPNCQWEGCTFKADERLAQTVYCGRHHLQAILRSPPK